jgi:hypothetical protein
MRTPAFVPKAADPAAFLASRIHRYFWDEQESV